MGEQSVDPELVMLLVCVVPIATLIITALPPNPKRIGWPAWLGTTIATVGLVIVIGPRQLFDEPSELQALLMVVFGFASFALSNVLAERMMKGIAPAAVGAITSRHPSLHASEATSYDRRHASPTMPRPNSTAVDGSGIVALTKSVE